MLLVSSDMLFIVGVRGRTERRQHAESLSASDGRPSTEISPAGEQFVAAIFPH